MSFIAVAALLKLEDLPQFASDLKTWRIIPGSFVGPLTTIVPAIELIVSGAWLLSLVGKPSRYAGILMLAACSVAFLTETLLFGAPKCGCLGKLAAWESIRDEVPWVISRNLILSLMLGVGAEFRGVRVVEGVDGRLACRARPSQPRAFTVLELLLVIVLVALLVALTLPSLGQVRTAAKSVRVLSDLKSHMSVAAAYAIDQRDFFPCIADPGATHFVADDGDTRELLPYFGMRVAWWKGLSGYYNGAGLQRVFVSPKTKNVYVYQYSDTCVARPEYWNLKTRTQEGQIGGTRLTEVVFPSKKGVYADWSSTLETAYYYGFDRPIPVESSLADGSAAVFQSNMLLLPVATGDGPNDWPRVFPGIPQPILFTIGGVAGRDVR